MAVHSSSASLADEGSRDFRKKESAQESEYASREERRTLAEMLARMERDADPDGSKAKKVLEPLLQKHGVKSNAKLLEELISWKQKPAPLRRTKGATDGARDTVQSAACMVWLRDGC